MNRVAIATQLVQRRVHLQMKTEQSDGPKSSIDLPWSVRSRLLGLGHRKRSSSEWNNQLAVHQFRFGLLPRGPLIDKYGALPQFVVAEDFDLAWQQQPGSDVALIVDAIAPRYHSWSNDILMWGSENGNRIHVVYETAKIVEVSCRIAVPIEHEEFANGVIKLAGHFDWLLVLTNDALSEPKLDLLLAAVRESNAAKFTANPLEFFDGISSGKYHPD